MMTQTGSGDSYSAFEHRFIGAFRQGLLWVTRPLVSLLARLGVHPNALSASQIVGGFVLLALVPAHPRLAFVLLLVLLLIDGLDGALARATGKASAFGGLVDQYCDHIREVTSWRAWPSGAGWRSQPPSSTGRSSSGLTPRAS